MGTSKKLRSSKLVVDDVDLHEVPDLKIKGYKFFSIGDEVGAECGAWAWLVVKGKKVFLVATGCPGYKRHANLINYVPGKSTKEDAEELRQLLLKEKPSWWL